MMLFRLVCHLLCLLRLLEIHALQLVAGLLCGRPEADGRWALIIRNDFLGDFVISAGALRALCRYFHDKGYKVALVLSERNREAGEAFPDCDRRIYLAHRANFRRRWREYMVLRRLKAEVAVRLPCAIGSDIRASWAAVLSGARQCIGLQPQILTLSSEGMNLPVSAERGQGALKRVLTRRLSKRTRLLLLDAWRYRPFRSCFAKIEDVNPAKSIAENESRLVSLVIGNTEMPLCFTDNLEWLDGSTKDLEPLLPPQGRPFYVVVMGASQVNRTWEPARFAQVIRRLAVSHPELCPLVCGTAGEAAAADSVLQMAGGMQVGANLCGRTTLAQLCALLRRARFVLANETGTAHLAAAVQAPLCLLLGGGLRGLHSPSPLQSRTAYVTAGEMPCARCNWLCHCLDNAGRPPCLARIAVEDVLVTVEKLCGLH